MVTHQLQVKRRTGKVRRPETDVLPLCHATNWIEVVEKDCQACKQNKEDAIDCSRQSKLIKDFSDQDGCEWVNVSSGTCPAG